MANVKFSQFTAAGTLSATGFIVGYDGANNTRITKAILESSLVLANISGSIDLTNKVTGTLPIANGGTGNTTASAAFNALSQSAAETDDKIVTVDSGAATFKFPYENAYIPTNVTFTAFWTGATNPYFNLVNGSNNVIPFDDSISVKSTSAGLNFPTLNIVSTTNSTITIPSNLYGYWKITTIIYLFDVFGNVDIAAGVLNADTSAVIAATIDTKAAEITNNRAFYGVSIVNIDATNDEIQMYINPSANTPFPANSDNLRNAIILEYIGS
jgi:hypothetical protein